MHRIVIFLFAAAFLAGAFEASADPDSFPVCTAAGDQTMPVIVPDGFSGAVIVWHDLRPGSPGGGVCYAQRVDSTGAPMWGQDGVQLFTTGDINDPVAVGDGVGGAYVAFGGQGNAPRAQYINFGGALQWGPDGVTLSTATTQARELAITGSSGEVIVAWRQDNGTAGSSDIFGQKLDFFGTLQWNPGGQALETTTNNEMLPAMISDGAGGMILAYVDATANAVKVMGIKSNGTGAWSRVPVSASANNTVPSIVSDGAGGAIVGWAGGGSYVQRVSDVGTREWSPGSTGVLLSTGGHQTFLLPGVASSAIAVWEDFRSGTNYNIYAQGLLSNGASAWTANGVEVCAATQDQRLPQIVTDGAGGAIITWYDYRTSNATGTDIYAQRIASVGGASQWLADGIPLCTAPDNQEYPTITSDKEGGAWVAWQDHRNGTDYDIYLQRVHGDATTLAVPPASISAASSVRAWPNPFSARVQMPFTLPAPAQVRLSVIDVGGRLVRDLGTSWIGAGAHELQWDGTTSSGSRAAPGLYFLRVNGAGVALSRSVVHVP
jgi:flagellar hook capping protein FlgD